MKVLLFCPVDGFILDEGFKCPECNEIVERPIVGQFSDESAKRMEAIQNSGQGMPA
jgi:transcription initiation factor IIE alpha subunit